jgi:hypothetical protein
LTVNCGETKSLCLKSTHLTCIRQWDVLHSSLDSTKTILCLEIDYFLNITMSTVIPLLTCARVEDLHVGDGVWVAVGQGLVLAVQVAPLGPSVDCRWNQVPGLDEVGPFLHAQHRCLNLISVIV